MMLADEWMILGTILFSFIVNKHLVDKKKHPLC
jgi:hypothetical protein